MASVRHGGDRLRDRAGGAQRASLPDPSVHRTRGALRALIAALLVATAGAALPLPGAASPARAATEPPRAAVIVGPASSSTREFLSEGERIARQAEAVGMEVVRVFTPHATWKRVKAAVAGADLIVYLGHGNGWPSVHPPYNPETKNGLGLNPCDGTCGTTGPTRYYGTAPIQEELRPAPDAIVLLHRLCFASGNGEGDDGPVFDRDLAVERVTGYAATFLALGAAAVFAWGWPQRVDLPRLLMRSDLSMDEIFMIAASDSPTAYDGFIGKDDYTRDSPATAGARTHLDPHPRWGHLRALTGSLGFRASEWRGTPPPPDDRAPVLAVNGAGTSDAPVLSRVTGRPVPFSPNDDDEGDRLVIERRLSEPATVTMAVRDASGRVVRTARSSQPDGAGRTAWDGRDDAGARVPDGRYTIALTPRDRAGNVGRTSTVPVLVLTALRRLQADVDAIDPADGDRLAASVSLEARLLAEARVTWTVRRDGRVVRTRYADRPLPAGNLGWAWDGRDDRGRLVPEGDYEIVVAAETAAGTLRSQVRVHVGSWRIAVSDRTPSRGDRVELVLRSTERLGAAPTLRVVIPGLAARTLRTVLDDPYRATATLLIPRTARVGRVVVTIAARDVAGGREPGRTVLVVR